MQLPLRQQGAEKISSATQNKAPRRTALGWGSVFYRIAVVDSELGMFHIKPCNHTTQDQTRELHASSLAPLFVILSKGSYVVP